MAKKKEGASEKIIRVPDLAKELGVEPRTLRMFIRKLGFNAPETGIEGFGPKRKYEWKEGDKQLKQIREAWKEAQKEQKEEKKEEKSAGKGKGKGKAKKEEPQPEPEEEELEEDEEFEYEDEDEEEDEEEE